MKLSDFSLVLTSVICYGIPSLLIYPRDYWFSYYSIFLAIFSSLYHYHNEYHFFHEDFVCSFFLKLHILSNYVWWLPWKRFLVYTFFSEIIGYCIFYFSFQSWKKKYKNYNYTIIHNLWHFYTGFLAFFCCNFEKRVNIGHWDEIFMFLFIITITSYNLKKKLWAKGLIMSSFYVWNIANFYNIVSLLILSIVAYLEKINKILPH